MERKILLNPGPATTNRYSQTGTDRTGYLSKGNGICRDYERNPE